MPSTSRLVPVVLATAFSLLAGCTSSGASAAPSPATSPLTSPAPSVAVSPSPAASPAASPVASASPAAASCVNATYDFTADARGPKGDPVELARAALSGLQPTDSLRRQDDATGVGVVVLRGGAQAGRVHFTQDRGGGWLLDGAELCGGLGLPSGGAAPASAAPPARASAVPSASSAARFDLAACRTKGLCGSATLEPAAARVGAAVTVATGAYYPVITRDWCPDFGVAFDYTPADTASGTLRTAPLVIVDESHAVFQVPSLPVGAHTVTFVCGHDAGFAHPEFEQRLVVLPAPG